LIVELGIAEQVRLLGFLPYPAYLAEAQKAHIALAPSVTAENGDTEGGAPVMLLEAQAMGLPVISSYHADVPNVLVEGKSAFLAPERDVSTLTEHLVYLSDHPEVWPAMGQAGREYVAREHNIQRQVEKLESIYDQLVA
jgi:colanic acid/amylovoran biosynthesis glycosyltransferase